MAKEGFWLQPIRSFGKGVLSSLVPHEIANPLVTINHKIYMDQSMCELLMLATFSVGINR